jgi:uncharacterized protein (TIGR03435 family)
MKTTSPCLIVFAGFICLAQSPSRTASVQPPAFEVASVRLAAVERSTGPDFRTSPDSLTIVNLSLRNCIQIAYEMQETQLSGPGWLDDVRLDIAAKAAGPVEAKQLRLMLRTLLAERLGLKVHIERKEIPVYALTLAKGGPKFSESTTEGPPVFRPDKGAQNGQHIAMSDLAMFLSKLAGRPVIDATELKGRYDIRIDLTPYEAPATTDGSPQDASDIWNAFLTAVQGPLGLKIEARKDQVDVLVVDRAEKTPTKN